MVLYLWEISNISYVMQEKDGKYIFGVVKVGDKGQIVIPAKARRIFDINSGDRLVVLGDEGQGLAVIKADHFLSLASTIKNEMFKQ